MRASRRTFAWRGDPYPVADEPPGVVNPFPLSVEAVAPLPSNGIVPAEQWSSFAAMCSPAAVSYGKVRATEDAA